MVINYKDGELDGLFKKWDENGRIIGEKNYKDGKVIYFDVTFFEYSF